MSGESYDLLGKSLRLKVEANKDETVYTDGVYIFLRVKDKDDFRHKEIMMSKWFKQYQTTVFEELLQEKYLLFEKYGVFDYIREFYDVLHTTGYQYINHDIDLYLKARKAEVPG